MGINTKIEWCHASINLWHGCVSCSTGCLNCYAEAQSKRFGNDIWGNDKPRLEIKSAWDNLDKMQRLAKAAGEMHRVFVGSMMDIFEKPMPMIDSKGEKSPFNTHYLRVLLFEAIEDGRYPNLLFLFLTKRPSNIPKYILPEWHDNPPDNVMFGTSPVNQDTAGTLIWHLLQVKGKKFLSVEPMLGPVYLTSLYHNNQFYSALEEGALVKEKIDWVIVGGESGPHKRPFSPVWARRIRDDCKASGTPFFMKQIDKVQPIPEDLMIREF